MAMLYDITLKITTTMIRDALTNEDIARSGHLGTHFDLMDKTFPLEYTRRKGIVFDVRGIRDREIGLGDVDLSRVEEGMFAAFCTGFLEEAGYGCSRYFREHPVLSMDLIHALVEKRVSIIGIDAAGVRRGKEHTPTDQWCADRGVFIVENLSGLEPLVGKDDVIINTFPMNYVGLTGLPSRVIAEA